MSSNLVLYVDAQFVSPFAMPPFVALHEKGLSFEMKAVDLMTRENLESGYVSASLTGRIPMLVHDGFALSESSAIVEYVDEVFPGPALMPLEAGKRARARQVMAWLRTDLAPIRAERSSTTIFHKADLPPLSEAAAEAAGKLFFVADNLLSERGDGLFDEWSIADLELAFMLNRLVANGDAVPGRLADYARRQFDRPAARLWVDLKRPAG